MPVDAVQVVGRQERDQFALRCEIPYALIVVLLSARHIVPCVRIAVARVKRDHIFRREFADLIIQTEPVLRLVLRGADIPVEQKQADEANGENCGEPPPFCAEPAVNRFEAHSGEQGARNHQRQIDPDAARVGRNRGEERDCGDHQQRPRPVEAQQDSGRRQQQDDRPVQMQEGVGDQRQELSCAGDGRSPHLCRTQSVIIQQIPAGGQHGAGGQHDFERLAGERAFPPAVPAEQGGRREIEDRGRERQHRPGSAQKHHHLRQMAVTLGAVSAGELQSGTEEQQEEKL